MDHFNLQGHIKLITAVKKATFNAESKKWELITSAWSYSKGEERDGSLIYQLDNETLEKASMMQTGKKTFKSVAKS